MDTLTQISGIASSILPILGVIVLIAVFVLMIELIAVVKDVNKATHTVNGYLDELNVTVKTVNNVAMSVEAIRVAASSLATKAIKNFTNTYDSVKKIVDELLDNFFAKMKKEQEEKSKEEATELPVEEK